VEVSRISSFVHDNSPLRLSIPTASAALALAFAFCSPIRAAVPTDPARTTAYAGDRIILKFKSEAHDAAKSGLHTALGAQKIERLDCIDAEVFRLQPGMSVEAAIAAALQDPEVEYAEPDYELRIARLPNDPRLNELYAIQNHGQTGGFPGADIHMASAWDVFTGNSEIKVGIIDTGVDYTHPDLAANIWTNPGEVPGNSVDDDRNGYVDDVHGYDFVGQDGDPMDDHAHGTHCAGTIGAVGDNSEGIAGINWHCRIVAIKFMDDLGRGNLSNAIRGIEYAIRVGAAVTSNSYEGGGYSRAFQDAIAAAGRANQLFVAAAGNAGADNDIAPVYPAGYDLPNVIAVAATDHKDRLAGFSNYGARSVDLAAPGVAILSTKLGGGYLASSGTSMAAPHVAGRGNALVRSASGMPAATIKALLLSGTDPIPALTGRCVSGGRLNVARALVGTDAVPPAGVADLLAVSTPSAVALLFTAPGDDGATGRATRYEVRYAPTPINAARFAAATAVTAPAPQAAGTAERFEISGLAFGTTYYFALKTLTSTATHRRCRTSRSRAPAARPEIAVSPASVSSRLASGATTHRSVRVRNEGTGRLEFRRLVPNLFLPEKDIASAAEPLETPRTQWIRVAVRRSSSAAAGRTHSVTCGSTAMLRAVPRSIGSRSGTGAPRSPSAPMTRPSVRSRSASTSRSTARASLRCTCARTAGCRSPAAPRRTPTSRCRSAVRCRRTWWRRSGTI
jgi:subtilisin family serine protease